jgi:AcrR family transcriptional regulator
MFDGMFPTTRPTYRSRRGLSHRLDKRIIEATITLIGRDGPAGVSIEAVARQAGCSRSSIYRRGSTKEDLILAALGTTMAESASCEQGRILESTTKSRALSLRTHGDALSLLTLMGEMVRGTELGRRYLAEVFVPIRQARLGCLTDAVADGEIRSDVDIDLLLDIVSGALLFRAAHRGELEPDLPERLTSLLLQGVSGETP